MSLKHLAIVLISCATFAVPGAARALTCFDLPEEARAAGALQGLSTCDMSIAEARRVLARRGGYDPGYEEAAPPPRVGRRRHRAPSLEEE